MLWNTLVFNYNKKRNARHVRGRMFAKLRISWAPFLIVHEEGAGRFSWGRFYTYAGIWHVLKLYEITPAFRTRCSRETQVQVQQVQVKSIITHAGVNFKVISAVSQYIKTEGVGSRRAGTLWVLEGAHLSEILGEGAKWPSGGRVWEEYPPPTVGTFLKIEFKSRVCRAFKNNFLGN